MDIRKTKKNFDKDKKPKCFNYEIYEHMAKDCQKLKKEKNTQKFINMDKQCILPVIIEQNRE